jgi:hypothetical protein
MTRPPRSETAAYCRYWRAATRGGHLRISSERLRPLVALLVDVYGGYKPLAQALGMSHVTFYRILRGEYRGANPDTVRRLVEAVKAHEARLRDEARREHVRTERARYAR